MSRALKQLVAASKDGGIGRKDGEEKEDGMEQGREEEKSRLETFLGFISAIRDGACRKRKDTRGDSWRNFSCFLSSGIGRAFPRAGIETARSSGSIEKKDCFRTRKQQRNKLFPIAGTRAGNQLTFELRVEKLREFIIRNVDNFETSRKPSPFPTALLPFPDTRFEFSFQWNEKRIEKEEKEEEEGRAEAQ